MSTEKNNIFNTSNSLSEKDIKDYLDGKLSQEERNAIEQKSQNSALETEALEGFEANPKAIALLPGLKNQFSAKYTSSSTNSILFKNILVAASITGVAVFVTSLFWMNQPNQNNNLVAEVVESKETPLQEEKRAEIEAIEEAEVIHDSSQIKSEDVIENTPITLHFADAIENEPIQEEEIAEAISESFQLNTMSAKAVKITVPEKNILKSNTKTKYINDFLVVDYSDIYAINELEDDFNLSGTPAKYKSIADKEDNNSSENISTKDVDYQDYLSLTLSKFKNNNYKSALINFNTIIDQYPNDLNAHYYGGLCYYNIDNPTKAIDFFDFILNQNINTFHQEAQYYKAMCLIRLGQADQAKFIFQKIVSQNGFFIDQAKAMLDKTK